MFKSQNFCHIASNNRNQVKVGVFVYRTTDSLATVLASGYFNDRIIDINLHDLIIHEKVDNADATKVERNLLCVTERTLENVGTTVIKSKWEGDIEQAIADLQTYIDNNFVKLDGTSVMSAPLKFSAGSMRGAVGPYLNGVSFWKSDSQGTITNIANLTDSQFTPVTTNSINLGNTTHTWKDAYVARVITSVLNNGYDIAVPVTNSADTLALKSEVDLAANSGRMITDQGVWYAKMYAATVAPSAENGTNYADFSQTDGQGNPIIVIYERQNGAWVQSETITPPAEYDGYVPITSKIWDIVEQAGQQGGRVLWNHQSKDFTPYPQIISFENAALTGTSTAPTPTESSPNNQIANKEYVDNKTSQQGYHPDLFDVKWADHICNDVQWLRADTFSWQSGAVYQAAYQHLVDDVFIRASAWFDSNNNITCYTDTETPQVGDATYSRAGVYLSNRNDNIVLVTDDSITTNSGYSFQRQSADDFLALRGLASSETIAGITVYFYVGADNHKVALINQESNIEAIYNATGVAWYYIIDTTNQRFKLPRTKFGFTGIRSGVGNYVEAGLPNLTGDADSNGNDFLGTTTTGVFSGTYHRNGYGIGTTNVPYGNYAKTLNFNASLSNSIYGNSDTVQPKATEMYLYFYVGQFTQTALENTAGINAELFNDKVDIGDAVGFCSFNTETRVQITTTNQTAAKNGWLIGRLTFSGSNTSATVYVNDITAAFGGYSSSGYWGSVSIQIPIKAGQTYKYSTDGTVQSIEIYFYPND